jgi:AcrR family transcriptional regulator
VASQQPARRSGRPIGFDVERATDQLVELFWRRGYDQVSQRDMAAATGLSTSSLYNTFGNKPEIFQQVMRRYLCYAADLLTPLTEGAAGTADVVEFFVRLREKLSGGNTPAGCLVVTTMCTHTHRDDGSLTLAAAHRARLLNGFHTALARGKAQGEHLPAAPSQLAAVLVAALIGVFATGRSGGATEVEAQIDGLIGLVKTWR